MFNVEHCPHIITKSLGINKYLYYSNHNMYVTCDEIQICSIKIENTLSQMARGN